MYKHDTKSVLIKTLSEGYTITAACKTAGVSRMFYDRHYKSDPIFRKSIDVAHKLGREMNNDRAVSMQMKLINEGRWQPTKYYLEHHVEPYMQKTSSPPFNTHVLLKGVDAYAQFIRWTVMTVEERVLHGVETREQFCKTYNVPNIGMLGIWSKRKDFEPRVTALREEWVFSKTSEILGGVYIAARNGDYRSQRLWLEHVFHMKEKQDAKKPNAVEIPVGDIRFIIESLPEPLKSKYYTHLRELLDDSTKFAQARTQKEYQDAGILDENGETKPFLPDDPTDNL